MKHPVDWDNILLQTQMQTQTLPELILTHVLNYLFRININILQNLPKEMGNTDHAIFLQSSFKRLLLCKESFLLEQIVKF